jgi:hypothetical protein
METIHTIKVIFATKDPAVAIKVKETLAAALREVPQVTIISPKEEVVALIL